MQQASLPILAIQARLTNPGRKPRCEDCSVLAKRRQMTRPNQCQDRIPPPISHANLPRHPSEQIVPFPLCPPRRAVASPLRRDCPHQPAARSLSAMSKSLSSSRTHLPFPATSKPKITSHPSSMLHPRLSPTTTSTPTLSRSSLMQTTSPLPST